jgi:hypothetical protein
VKDAVNRENVFVAGNSCNGTIRAVGNDFGVGPSADDAAKTEEASILVNEPPLVRACPKDPSKGFAPVSATSSVWARDSLNGSAG